MDSDNGNTEENGDHKAPSEVLSKVDDLPTESSMEISPTLMDLYDTLANSNNQSISINDNEQSSNQDEEHNQSTNQNVKIDLQPVSEEKSESGIQTVDEPVTNQNAGREHRPISGMSTSSVSSMDSQSSKSYNKDVSSPDEDNRKIEELSMGKEDSNESVSFTGHDQNEQGDSASVMDSSGKSPLVIEGETVTKTTLAENVSETECTDNKETEMKVDTYSDVKLEIIEEQIVPPSDQSLSAVNETLDTGDDSKTLANQTDERAVNRGHYVKHGNQEKAESVQSKVSKSTGRKTTDTNKGRKSSRINPPFKVDPAAGINGAASPPVSPPQKTKLHHKSSKQDNVTYIIRVVTEIVETERSYVKDLDDIIEGYLHVILDEPELPISPQEYSTLFGNIEEIYEFNKGLLDELESCDLDPIRIAECFVDKDDGFKRYTQYCTNYPDSVAVLTELSEISGVMKFFKSRQSALKHPLPLGSYLLKPVQRILKYRLLFQEIHRHFDNKGDGFDVIKEALATMTRIARYINEMKRKHETAVHVQEIQSQLHGWDGTLISYGELVLEDVFRMVGARADRFLFLFYKALLIGKKREDGLISIKAVIMCDNMILQEVVQRDTLWFVIIPFDNNKLQYIIQAKSMEHKRLWTHHLKRLIIENHPLAVPMHAKQVILDQDKDKYYASDDSAELLDRRDNGWNKEERRNKRPHTRHKSDPSTRKLRRGSVQLKVTGNRTILHGMKKPEIISPRSSMRKSQHTSGHSSTEMDTQDTQSESESPHKKKSSLQSPSQKTTKKSRESKVSKEEAVQKSGSLTRSDYVKSKSLDSLATPHDKPSSKNSLKQLGGDDSSPRAQRLGKKLDDINPRDSVGWSNEIVEAVEAAFDKMKKDDSTLNGSATDLNSQKPDSAESSPAINRENASSAEAVGILIEESQVDRDVRDHVHHEDEEINSGSDDNIKTKLVQRKKSLPRNDLIQEEPAPLAAEKDIQNANVKGDAPIREIQSSVSEGELAKQVDAYTVPRRKPPGTHVKSNYRSSTSVLEQINLRNAVFKIKRTDKMKQYSSQNQSLAKDAEDVWVKRTDTMSSSQPTLLQSRSVASMYTHYSQTYLENAHLPKLSISRLNSSPEVLSPTSPQSGKASPLSPSSQISPSKETLIDADMPLPAPPPSKETLIGIDETETTRTTQEEQSKVHHSSDDLSAATAGVMKKMAVVRSLSEGTERSLGDDAESLRSVKLESITSTNTDDSESMDSKSLPPEAEEILDESEKYVVENSKRTKKSVPSFPAAGSGQTEAKTESASSNESVTDNIKNMLHNLGSRLTAHKTPSPGPSPRSSQCSEQTSSSDECKSTKQTQPGSPDKEQKAPKVYQLARAYSQRIKSKASKSFSKKRSSSESSVNIIEESYEHRLANLLGGENAQGGASIGARYAKQGDTLNRNLKHSWSETIKPIIFETDEMDITAREESPVFTRSVDTHTVMLRQKVKKNEEEEDEDFAARRQSVRESIMNFEEIMKAVNSPTVPNYSSHSRIQGLLMDDSNNASDRKFKTIEERRRELEEQANKPVPRQRILSEFLDVSDGSSVSSAESDWTSRYSSAPTSPQHRAVEGLSLSTRTSSSEEGELMPIIMKSIKQRFQELQESISKPVAKTDAKLEIRAHHQVAEGAGSDDDSQEDLPDSRQSTLKSESVLPVGQTDTIKEAMRLPSSGEVRDDDDDKYQLGGESDSDSGNTSDSEYETPIGSLENIADILSTLDTLEDLPADISDEDSIEDEATLEAEQFDETYKSTASLEAQENSTQNERTLDIETNAGQSESQA